MYGFLSIKETPIPLTVTTYQLLEIDPKNVDALSYKGCSLHELGKSDDAMKCFDTALEVRC